MARRRKPNPRKAGFTLIEALAALGIASVMMAAIFTIQQQLVSSQKRFDDITRRANLQHDALALVRDVNPSNVAQGDIPMPPNMTLHWTSVAVSDAKLTAGFPRGDGRYTATLYRVTVNVVDRAGHDLIDPFAVERVGYVAGDATSTVG
jgi:prepilin-type N-terminal cleavage/methylation domain-containing protein